MNRQSNTYTIIYATLLVVVVGLALSLVYQALRPAQVENINNDTRRQILAAARIEVSPKEDVAAIFADHVKRSFIVSESGAEVTGQGEAFDVNVAEQVKRPAAERLLPVFECTTDAGVKYILPVYGAGLWGPIWGYIAMDADGRTIYGAYFAHQGETPGLGAEIEKPKFQNQFEGKTLMSTTGSFEPIEVIKAGQKATGEYVDAISGGTITSRGVQQMLDDSLRPYENFLRTLESNNTADTAEVAAAGEENNANQQ